MPLHFPKCFIDFRAIYRRSERRYSYQSTEHIFRLYFLLTIILRSCRRLYSPTYYSSTASGPPSLTREGYKKTKNALLLQDTAYILLRGARTHGVLGATHLCSPYGEPPRSNLHSFTCKRAYRLTSFDYQALLSRSTMHTFTFIKCALKTE